MTVSADRLHKGQIVKFRNVYGSRKGRTAYMRLLMDCPERVSDDGTFVRLYGYRTRADGSPTHVRPVVRTLYATEVEVVGGAGGAGQ
jgi:hypothetical protein